MMYEEEWLPTCAWCKTLVQFEDEVVDDEPLRVVANIPPGAPSVLGLPASTAATTPIGFGFNQQGGMRWALPTSPDAFEWYEVPVSYHRRCLQVAKTHARLTRKAST